MTLDEFKERWLESFASSLYTNPRDKFLIHTEQYIWHLFSWKYLPEGSFLAGDDARSAFDRIERSEKESAVFIEPFSKNKLFSSELGNICANDLDECIEIYVAAKDFSWTYIATHEGDLCGPYYCDTELLSLYFEKGDKL